MTFARLFAEFRLDRPDGDAERWEPAGVEVAGFGELMGLAAGARFDRGVYRLHTARSGAEADASVAVGFPEMADRVRCFGYDWLGRQFALDLDPQRRPAGEPLVLLLEPGTGEALEVPETFRTFHEGLDGYPDVLASDAFDEWVTTHGDHVPLPMDVCVGYRVPLFLGGSDTPDNFEVIDIKVYWTISAQTLRQVRGLPPGTRIGRITIG